MYKYTFIHTYLDTYLLRECLFVFRTKKLLKTMREEYRCRSPYVAYLVRCRQGLLTSLALIERLLVRVER